MSEEQNLLQCYNRGCGQKFSPENNTENSCCHHPGTPVFHDAYKGWSCCSKKSTDFTEFLNIKGCTLSKHSNVKPANLEPSKQVKQELTYTQPAVVLNRPPLDTPFTVLKSHIAVAMKSQPNIPEVKQSVNSQEIAIGTICKHGGCNIAYESSSDSCFSTCFYHPGVPVFHEGLKFWSCCQKRTTDFNSFLNQPGCERGQHLWKNEDTEKSSVQCRWDYHQTGSYVVVSIYAKEYHIDSSVVKVNPVRVYIKLVFPEKNNACFEMDMELFGIVDVNLCEATMYPTKVEVKLKKAIPCYWPTFEMKRMDEKKMNSSATQQITSHKYGTDENIIEDIDISNL